MDFELFVEKFRETQGCTEDTLPYFCDNVLKIAKNPEDLYEKEVIKSLFYSSRRKSKNMNRTKYYRMKNLISLFFDELAKETEVPSGIIQLVNNIQYEDVITSDSLSKQYFGSLSEALNFVARFVETFGYAADRDLLNIQSLIILVWNGVSLEEISSIKKKDLVEQTYSVSGSALNKAQDLALDAKTFYILWNYAHHDRLLRMKSARDETYTQSEFLFRSGRSSKLSTEQLQRVIIRFNAWLVDSGITEKELNLRAIKQNGIFERAISIKENDPITYSFFVDRFDCAPLYARECAATYKRWKDMYRKDY